MKANGDDSAFPTNGDEEGKGMTKKEFAAVEAMKAFIINSRIPITEWTNNLTDRVIQESHEIAHLLWHRQL